MTGNESDELYQSLRRSPSRAVTFAHLGQSLDGFIATRSGDSRFVNGQANLVHLHRMRSLCDAVIVGAGTIAADDPQLTTRLVDGPSPLRVVIDPGRRLGTHFRVFADGAAPTWLASRTSPASQAGQDRHGAAEVVSVPGAGEEIDLAALLGMLRERGYPRVFVEGGGRTVSAFLAAGLIDRLQLAVASFVMGDGRPGIRLPAPDRLGDCARPVRRVYRMGEDILFDFDLASGGVQDTGRGVPQDVVRVL